MPLAIKKALKWKLTTITPIVIRKVLLNSGFRLLKRKFEEKFFFKNRTIVVNLDEFTKFRFDSQKQTIGWEHGVNT